MRARLSRDVRGATMVEFAIVLPVMMMLIMGMSDLTFRLYLQSVLSGAVQRAGRDSTIEGNDGSGVSTKIDQAVFASVLLVSKNATYVSSRKSYATFGAIAPEPFSDDNRNNRYDQATECFTDLNGNKQWDADPGMSGQGGANDVTVYKMVVTYPRLFPLSKLLGLPDLQSIAATTILKNQPYKEQSAFTPTQVCP